MPEPTTIVQKKFDETLSFCFEDESLVRRHSDRSGTNEIRVFYENLELHNWTTATVDKLKKYRIAIQVFGMVCALISLAAPLPLAARAVLFSCALLALGLEIARRCKAFSVKYSMFKILNPQTRWKFVKILHDENHDRIVIELKSHWLPGCAATTPQSTSRQIRQRRSRNSSGCGTTESLLQANATTP